MILYEIFKVKIYYKKFSVFVFKILFRNEI